MARSKMGSSPVWRAVAALAAAMLIAGALSGGSAVAGKFLTKKKADKRYYNVGETVAQAQNATNAQNATTAQNANTLDGYDSAVTLGRVAGAGSDTYINDFTSATFTTILSTSITAPSSGFLQVNASVSFEDDASFSGAGCLMYRVTVDGTANASDPFAYVDCSDASTGTWQASGALNVTVPVAAGSHTIALQAREAGSGSFIIGRNVSALFAPTGSGVTIPARSSARAPADQPASG